MIEIKTDGTYMLQKLNFDESVKIQLLKGTIILDSGPLSVRVSGTNGETEEFENGFYLTILTLISPSLQKGEEKQ